MNFSKVREVKSPNRGTENSAGIDFYIPVGFDQKIMPQDKAVVSSGIKVDIPDGTMLQVCNKSGVASKKGLIVGAHIIDSDYQGEILINVWNISDKMVTLDSGTKLVQLVLVPILIPKMNQVLEDDLFKDHTERGDGGFGSTGK